MLITTGLWTCLFPHIQRCVYLRTLWCCRYLNCLLYDPVAVSELPSEECQCDSLWPMSIKRRNSSWCVLLLLLRCEMKMLGTTTRHLVDNINKWSLTIWHSNLQMTDSLAIIVIEVKCNDEDDNGGCKLGRNSVKMVGDKVSCKLLRCKYLTSRACRRRWLIFHLAPFYFQFPSNPILLKFIDQEC